MEIMPSQNVSEKFKGKGIASVIIKEVENLCKGNRVNSMQYTHKDNISMQNFEKMV